MKKRRLFFVYCKLLEIEKLIVSKIILNTTSFEYSIKNIVNLLKHRSRKKSSDSNDFMCSNVTLFVLERFIM